MTAKKTHPSDRKKLIDFEMRQCFHIRIMKETYAALRILCFQNNLSLQEVMDEMCRLLVTGDPFVERMFLDISERKKQKMYRQLMPSDAQSLYDIIEIRSPLEKGQK